jgi:hypothetical protein
MMNIANFQLKTNSHDDIHAEKLKLCFTILVVLGPSFLSHRLEGQS